MRPDVGIDSPLPFGQPHRPISWTGTLLGLIALGMTLSAALFTYAFLGINEGGWPPADRPRPPVGPAAFATLILLASIPPALAINRAARDRRGPAVQACAAGMVLAAAAFLGLHLLHVATLDLEPAADAYSSTVLLIVVLHHVMLLGGMGAATVTLLQVWSSPDARVAGTATAVGLYHVSLVAAWLLCFAVLYLSPLLWGPP
jgi:heme/copper-type cytochrome/quinol oxidase subunit 3